MKEIRLEPTKDSLDILCAPGKIHMKGNSILPNPKKFFEDIFQWVEDYIQTKPEETKITLKFEYIDTASVSAVFDILKRFKQLENYRDKVTVDWYYEFDDPELLELGEIMEGRLDLDFNFVEYKFGDEV